MAFYMMNVAIQYFLFLNIRIFRIEPLIDFFLYFIVLLSLATHPLIYLYVKVLTKEKFRLTKRVIVHFLPAIVLGLISMVLTAQTDAATRALLMAPVNEVDSNDAPPLIAIVFFISTIFLFLQILFYAVLMFRLLYSHDKNIEEVYSYKQNLSLSWLKIFVVIYVLYYILEFVLFAFKGVNISTSAYYSLVALHVFFVGWMAFKQRDIYKNQLVVPGDGNTANFVEVKKEAKQENQFTSSEEDKIIETPDDSDKHLELFSDLQGLMEANQLYLDKELSLYDLAQLLHTNKNYLSKAINLSTGGTFYDFVNSYRIAEAKKMLLDPQCNHLSIEGIGLNSGFKSRSVFYSVFKKMEGKTPAAFRTESNG
jgi:AraC-like DNA-binding protein